MGAAISHNQPKMDSYYHFGVKFGSEIFRNREIIFNKADSIYLFYPSQILEAEFFPIVPQGYKIVEVPSHEIYLTVAANTID